MVLQQPGQGAPTAAMCTACRVRMDFSSQTRSAHKNNALVQTVKKVWAHNVLATAIRSAYLVQVDSFSTTMVVSAHQIGASAQMVLRQRVKRARATTAISASHAREVIILVGRTVC